MKKRFFLIVFILSVFAINSSVFAIQIYFVDPAGVIHKTDEQKIKSALFSQGEFQDATFRFTLIRDKEGNEFISLISADKKVAILLPVSKSQDSGGNDIYVLKDEKYFMRIENMNLTYNDQMVLIDRTPENCATSIVSYEWYWFEKLQ